MSISISTSFNVQSPRRPHTRLVWPHTRLVWPHTRLVWPHTWFGHWTRRRMAAARLKAIARLETIIFPSTDFFDFSAKL
jgi:hypothetical protein